MCQSHVAGFNSYLLQPKKRLQVLIYQNALFVGPNDYQAASVAVNLAGTATHCRDSTAGILSPYCQTASHLSKAKTTITRSKTLSEEQLERSMSTFPFDVDALSQF